MTTALDIIVVGGGIAGVSAAAELAAEARVTVIEAEPHLGYHSTGRSAAIFIRNYGNATLRALNAASEPVFRRPGNLAEAPVLAPRGEMLLAQENELDTLDSYCAAADGLERLSAAEAVALVPILRPERIAAAVIERAAQDIDVERTLQGYARRLRARGGRIVTGTQVTGIRRQGDHWQLTAGGDTYCAAILVNAAGAWADELARMAGAAPLSIRPMRRSAAILPAPGGHDIARWPLFGSVSETWYAKPDAGRLIVSPADEDPVDAHDAWADDMVLAEGLHRYEQAVTVPVTRVERSWAGLRSFAPDRTPVAGFDARLPGFFWLAGQGGYGVQTAPALARHAAALVAGRPPELPAAVVAALSPERFSRSSQ